MTIKTRKPTGKPSWPIALISGREGSGKSWACAVASASELVGRTFWVSFGEDDPDEYGIVPGADFEIVQHDGTYKGVLAVLTELAAEPPTDGKPNLIVFDSISRLWMLLADMAQEGANRRAIAKAKRGNKPAPIGDADVIVADWNVAASRWQHVISALRANRGPVLLTGRLEQVTVMDRNGLPTTEKQWKTVGHKTLPYDVRVIVELPERGEAWVTKVTSPRLQLNERMRWDGWSVEALWKRLGLADGEVGERTHTDLVVEVDVIPDEDASERDWIAEADAATSSKDAARIEAAAAVVLGPQHELVAAIHQIVLDKQGGPTDAGE